MLSWKKVQPGVYHATSPWGLYTIDGQGYGRNRWTVTYPGGDYGMVDALAEAKIWAEQDASERGGRKHHAVIRDISDDDWDVARDALLVHDPERAARIRHEIRKSHGFVTAPQSFLNALHEVPAEVRWKFEEHVSALEKTKDPSLPVFYEMVKHPRDQQIWFKATEALKKPGYKAPGRLARR